MRTRIKFCGLTRAADAEAAVRLGADAIGLVLAPDSPRFLQVSEAAIIRRRLPPFVQAVALFRNASFGDVMRALDELQPDLLQFHGDETPEFCNSFSWPYLRAVPMKHGKDLAEWERRYASASALLLDAHGAGEAGGQGRTFDWSAIRASQPYVLAGGLTPENVGAAVRAVRPYAVDVSSGIERSPGTKDEARMRQFVEAVRAADET
ncbi:MAG: phosphoribosylanthranilate isomerase [Nevskiaceae bacterium]